MTTRMRPSPRRLSYTAARPRHTQGAMRSAWGPMPNSTVAPARCKMFSCVVDSAYVLRGAKNVLAGCMPNTHVDVWLIRSILTPVTWQSRTPGVTYSSRNNEFQFESFDLKFQISTSIIPQFVFTTLSFLGKNIGRHIRDG